MGAAAERTLSVEERAEQKARAARLDPRIRPTDGATPWMRLKNRDPRRHYVWAPERGVQAGEFDVSYYLSLVENVNIDGRLKPSDGYVVEELTPNGPQPAAGLTVHPNPDGSLPKKQPVMFRGNVLLSCPIEFKRLIDAIGDDGSSGQRGADAMQRLFKARGAYVDTRRIVTPGIRLEKDPRAAGEQDVNIEERVARDEEI